MFKKLTLALLLGSVIAQPVYAEETPWEKRKEAFVFGLITGFIPVAGQALAFVVTVANLTDTDEPAHYDFAALFAAGHLAGMSVWAYPWYLVLRNRAK